MTDLLKKYLSDSLNSEELSQFRSWLASVPDSDLEKVLDKDWQDGSFNLSQKDKERLSQLKERIMDQCSPKRRIQGIVATFFKIAALIAIPVLCYTTWHWRSYSKQLADQSIVFSTQKGERSTISLPDGTLVTLNELSNLSYSPGSFNSKNRLLDFEGEAFFQVAKDSLRPFTVKSSGLSVTVLGTQFNLLDRASDNAELFLKEGIVQVLSMLSSQSAVLSKGDRAILSRNDGQLTILRSTNAEQESLAWLDHNIVLKKASFVEVLDRITKHYGVTFEANWKPAEDDTFTGTLPSDDLEGALSILEIVYHIRASISGRTVKISR